MGIRAYKAFVFLNLGLVIGVLGLNLGLVLKFAQSKESPVPRRSEVEQPAGLDDLRLRLVNTQNDLLTAKQQMRDLSLILVAVSAVVLLVALLNLLLLGKHPRTPVDGPGKKTAPAASTALDWEPMANFSPRSQQVLARARREADRMNHHFVGTEHVLLGLISLNQGVAVNVLRKMGVVLDSVRIEVEKQVGLGPDQKPSRNIPYTPRVKKVLALAAKEAKALNHTYVGTEHLLLGLLREGDGVAARIFANLEVDVDQTRKEILKELDPNV